MEIVTKSTIVIAAAIATLNRMPEGARRNVEGFVTRIRAELEYSPSGLGDIDWASAKLTTRFANIEAVRRNEYQPEIVVTLPIFRRFSKLAQVAIIAHEFAHATRAKGLGQGWHEKMQARYAAEETLADSLAVRWGFAYHINALRQEREQTVNPMLEAHLPSLNRRTLERDRLQQAALRAKFGVTAKGA